MIIKKTTITKGFIIAGLMNATVLIFSKLFTNSTIPEFDPEVMSNFGLLMILIWGLAYMSVAKEYHQVRWLVGIFVIEKFIYGFIWTNWIINNNVYDVYKKDVLAGLFYSIYGINDWVFFIFFLSVFIHLFRTKNSE
ncbi:hypothetical protein IWX83_002521 [Flavobacterium sp. CG_9.1]|uniref:Uncharacterized protein n=1 Tax=Flavobacterium xanthum TaxID=69322 RepID=A0A1M7CYD7_9FLAO|nr:MULTISPECIES: hypothetical protein [Flavobacterium]MBG6062720.1 hypothetical protein [Flavobacterium sp. CG_9.1]SHL72284.1 hypothetical protein SAMN05443669_101266 [Flavobacterium xanthum]